MNKRILTFILLTLTNTFVIAQNYYNITFEGTGVYENDSRHKLFIDTISNANNIWQIGTPNKAILSSALSLPNVVITDTANTYPMNDTSSFILSHVADLGFSMVNQMLISGSYNVNSDTLTDIGSIEFSPDNGGLWIDLNNPLSFSVNVVWNSGTAPVFSGNSNGWKHFSALLTGFNPTFNIQYGDTVQWRFTFKSDGIETNKDGIMFDSLYIWDVPPIGIQKHDSENPEISIFPNPANTTIHIEFENKPLGDYLLKVYSASGKIRDEHMVTDPKKGIFIDIKDYPDGIYFFTLVDKVRAKTTSGKFIKGN
jgi:hypothetical protein